MAPKNAYMQKRVNQMQEYINIGADYGMQSMADSIAISLNDSDFMGKQVMSGKKIKEIILHAVEVHEYYSKAFGSGEEADYYREKLDQRLRQVYKDEPEIVAPYNVRYPYCKEFKYGGKAR